MVHICIPFHFLDLRWARQTWVMSKMRVVDFLLYDEPGKQAWEKESIADKGSHLDYSRI